MRSLLLGLILATPLATISAQTPPAANPAATITQALTGDWVGVLEYRDYAEPATSTKRVQLPTWLTISALPTGVRFAYIYDDGPTKTVTSLSTVVIDPTHRTYTETGKDNIPDVSTIEGLDALREGRGTLILNGHGTDNNKPADTRVTLTIRRNLLTMVLEARPAGSADAFAFRHQYTFTRAAAPQFTAPALNLKPTP